MVQILPKVTSLLDRCGSLIMLPRPMRTLPRAYLCRSGAFRCRSAGASRQVVSDARCCAAATSSDGSTGVGSTITSETRNLAPAVLWPSRHLRLEPIAAVSRCEDGFAAGDSVGVYWPAGDTCLSVCMREG